VVTVDWRHALPGEPNKIRPAVIIEDHELFPDDYPTTIVVPLTSDQRLAHPTFALRIEPDAANGLNAISYALANLVTVASLERVRTTAFSIEHHQLAALRARVAEAIGVPTAS
jgi:mRNA-degrading endonuclease toxin of MazEF toxin-antitoxin module